MKIAVCCIAKNENRYIREWVEHYKYIGFDNVILCDNNDSEHFEDVINDYITSGYVIIENYRNKNCCQGLAYINVYKKYSSNYDWIAFFDCDEFLMLECNNIHEFISSPLYTNYNDIRICWENYDDNDLLQVVNNNYNNIKRFTRAIEGNNQCKSLLKTKLNISSIGAHSPERYTGIYACNTEGKNTNVTGEYLNNITLKNAKLNHYRLKTIEEFITIRAKRGDNVGGIHNKKCKLEYFWTINKKTKEKEELAKKLLS